MSNLWQLVHARNLWRGAPPAYWTTRGSHDVSTWVNITQRRWQSRCSVSFPVRKTGVSLKLQRVWSFKHYRVIYGLFLHFHEMMKRDLNGSNLSRWLSLCYSCKSKTEKSFSLITKAFSLFVTFSLWKLFPPVTSLHYLWQLLEIVLQERVASFSNSRREMLTMSCHISTLRFSSSCFSPHSVLCRCRDDLKLTEKMMNG